MFDSHTHLTHPDLIPQLELIIRRAKETDVVEMLNICTDSGALDLGLKIGKEFKGVHTAAAPHPHDVAKEGEAFLQQVEEQVGALTAIGETGLDYFYDHAPRKEQQRFLMKCLALATEAKLPVIFHCREAFTDLFAITDSCYQGKRAVVHCFTGTLQEARECLDRGWYISFSGIITFKKSEMLRSVVAYVPLERMLVETDAPYLAPQSRRGKLNEPSFMAETVAKIAEIRGIAKEEVIERTTRNAHALFVCSPR